MALFGSKIKTWEDLLQLRYHRECIENGKEKHKAFYYPTQELSAISLKDVRRLIKKGQDPNWKDAYGKPLLLHFMTSQSSYYRTCDSKWNGAQPEIIDYLLKNGANPNVSYTDAFDGERTLLEQATHGNFWSRNEPTVYTKILLNNGIDLQYQDTGIKAVARLLCPFMPQTNWQQRAEMILATGQVNIEKPLFYQGKDSLLDKVKESALAQNEQKDFLYQYYKKLAPEKADAWYSDILAQRRQTEEWERERYAEQKRQELIKYQQKKNQKQSVDPIQALRITSAALGVVAACYQTASAIQRYNSPVCKLKRMLGIRSY